MQSSRLLLAAVLFALPLRVFAHPVIYEVLWAGSDLSTSDEWLEIFNPDEGDVDLTGWTITSLNSKGEHAIGARFSSGTMLAAGQYMIVGRKTAALSRLLSEPSLLAPDLTLPNTNLLLRLRDKDGGVIDEVDDGSGVPFAGSNPSGTGSKASMERIDPLISGISKDNWRTAASSSGLDEGARVIATPFAQNSAVPAPSPSPCTDPLEIGIVVQSGLLSGTEKVTVNFQAAALAGTLSSASCSWDFSDGFTSTSCNPPSHSFTRAGTYAVRLQARNQCSVTLTAEQTVQVFGAPDGTLSTGTFYDGSRLRLGAALPNPEGADTGHEWVEIRNSEEAGVSLAGWKLRVGESPAKWIALKGQVDADSVLRIYDSEMKLSLPNTPTKLTLVTPSGLELSFVEWESADEGREYLSSDLRNLRVRGRVMRVIGSTVLEVQLEPDAAAIAGENHVYVKLLGITPSPLTGEQNSSDRLAYLTDLSKGKSMDLEFGTELWDAMGRLLAYAYTDQQISLQEQLLLNGEWMVDRALDFAKKDQFLHSESPLIPVLLAGEILPSALAQTVEEKSVSYPESAEDFSSIFLSEIFASPDPKLRTDSGSLMSQEWLEIGSKSLVPLSLSGFVVHAGSREKRLPYGLEVSSGSLVTVSLSDLHLSLKNAGDTVTLSDPRGVHIVRVEYPKLPYARSYALGTRAWCVSSRPTPGLPNDCAAVSPAVRAGKTAPVRIGVSPQVRRYAAAYRAELSEASTGEVTILSPESGDIGVIRIILAFLAGGVMAAGIVLGVQKLDSLQWAASSEKLHKV